MKDKVYATTESNFIVEIDPKTLDTLKKVNFVEEFPGNCEVIRVLTDLTLVNSFLFYGLTPFRLKFNQF